ncbi:MAG: Ldh family oxidoreductase [Bacillota bacterium]
MSNVARIAPDRLQDWSTRLLIAAGVPREDAEEVARHLLFADLRGIDTHGTSRLKIYLVRIASGVLSPTTRITVLRESPVSALLDGGNGLGHVISRRATDLAIAKAKSSGVGIVGVRNSNHNGCMAYYTLLMAEAGLIGFACTNSVANMPPWGGLQMFFGTNPISMAAPAAESPPFVFDMATSQVARGKIINAAREGKPIPEGWAMTREGLPTTDSKAAMEGVLLPMAGPKGSALAYGVEVLAGVLTGALIGPELPRMYEQLDQPQQVGHFFMAFRPDLFRPMEEFTRRMDQTAEMVRAVPPVPGVDQVLVPGDLERMRAEENRRLGVPITPGVRREFAEMAETYGVPLPEELQ